MMNKVDIDLLNSKLLDQNEAMIRARQQFLTNFIASNITTNPGVVTPSIQQELMECNAALDAYELVRTQLGVPHAGLLTLAQLIEAVMGKPIDELQGNKINNAVNSVKEVTTSAAKKLDEALTKGFEKLSLAIWKWSGAIHEKTDPSRRQR